MNIASMAIAADYKLSEDLKFTVAPYAWLTSVTATIGTKGNSSVINASFIDMIGSGGTFGTGMNVALMGHVEAIYRDRLGLLSDINFASLGTNVSAKSASLSGKSTLFLADIVPFYRFGTWGIGKAGSITFDGLAGIRVWNVKADFDVDFRRFSPSISKETSWVDPIVGARVAWKFNDDWSINLRGGIGGFGIGSDFTWDATGLVGYTFWEHGTLYAGYRAVGINRDGGGRKDELKFSGALHGPIIGVAFNF
ncbi:hypothetical protein NNJEOMEG_00634 [Fundidesulfovibrio magnetotacticus]|uniref:Outer membrane protein beta-barrel domain-containing protein n=2 Tax=Fundidesulfovibrio magnetotacticus TaxID=2730080 RepID=A0A6V8LT41_9BACT|nr:hypothetical protein NNJEOMEG_00634 [Fundidesulfovibrio magnetotacticus]